MTIEEKAKAYDEALKQAQYWLNAPQVIEDWNYTVKDIIPNIFPELKEIEFIIPHEDETDSEGLILPSYRARIDRYKSYLEKQKEQKPAEWSEEDEKMRQRIIRHIESEYQDWCKDKYGNSEIVSDGKESCRERIAWLKSLRPPQYCENCKLKRSVENWKPSEKQMYILNWVANILLNHDCIVEKEVAKKLQSLYNDLQKLL